MNRVEHVIRPLLLAVAGALLPLASLACSPAASTPAVSATSSGVEDFTLPDVRDGKPFASEFGKHPATVIAFLGTECPLTNIYVPTLARMHERYAAAGVRVVYVNSNPQDDQAEIVRHVESHGMKFPVVKDADGRIQKAFGASRTPEVFVVDAKKQVRYGGRIDDQFGIGIRRPAPTTHELTDALDDVLAGKPVRVAKSSAPGCALHMHEAKASGAEHRYTYGTHVDAIIEKNCRSCHQPGRIGPMPLITYKDARDWSPTIKEVVSENRMPPWLADPKHGEFANDRRLSKEDREALLGWIDDGCPEGPPPPAAKLAGKAGWTLQPDVTFAMTQPYDVPAHAPPPLGVPYQYFSIETNFPEDRWITAAEVLPGASEVVHHALVGFLYPGEQVEGGARSWKHRLTAFVPGRGPQRWPADTAKRIPKGARLILQVHYTPNGKAVKDTTSVGFVFSKDPAATKRMAFSIPIWSKGLKIPAGAENHEASSSFTFDEDALVLSVMPHMHLRGKDFRFERSDVGTPGEKTLLNVPRWDFNWQFDYVFKQPMTVKPGTKITATAHYDNSAKNPNNPDPTKEVKYGEQTWDEMMVGTMEVTFEKRGNEGITKIEEGIWQSIAPTLPKHLK
jgi:thiol-disulfide isomerase/thioredoxin/cytochrome c5